MKIISGGQTGADRGGLDAAIELGLEHGGWCPKGRRAEDGPIPARYQLVETASADYPKRTRLNVKMADVTIIFTSTASTHLSRGSRLTQRLCHEHVKPTMILNAFAQKPNLMVVALKKFFADHSPKSINIAGNRESKAPGIQEAVKNVLINALKATDA